MRALVLLYISRHTKFEVSSFTDSKDITGVKIKKPIYVSLTTPLAAYFSRQCKGLQADGLSLVTDSPAGHNTEFTVDR